MFKVPFSVEFVFNRGVNVNHLFKKILILLVIQNEVRIDQNIIKVIMKCQLKKNVILESILTDSKEMLCGS